MSAFTADRALTLPRNVRGDEVGIRVQQDGPRVEPVACGPANCPLQARSVSSVSGCPGIGQMLAIFDFDVHAFLS